MNNNIDLTKLDFEKRMRLAEILAISIKHGVSSNNLLIILEDVIESLIVDLIKEE